MIPLPHFVAQLFSHLPRQTIIGEIAESRLLVDKAVLGLNRFHQGIYARAG